VTEAHGGGPSLVVEPATARPGATVVVRGDDLGPDASVQLAIVGSAASWFLGSFAADGEGHMEVAVLVPAALPAGTYRLEAHIGGRSVATFLVLDGEPIGAEAPEGPDQADPLLVPLPADWNAPGTQGPSSSSAEPALGRNVGAGVEGLGTLGFAAAVTVAAGVAFAAMRRRH